MFSNYFHTSRDFYKRTPPYGHVPSRTVRRSPHPKRSSDYRDGITPRSTIREKRVIISPRKIFARSLNNNNKLYDININRDRERKLNFQPLSVRTRRSRGRRLAMTESSSFSMSLTGKVVRVLSLSLSLLLKTRIYPAPSPFKSKLNYYSESPSKKQPAALCSRVAAILRRRCD